ncbi:MAG: hypothetical protein OJF50_000262 [Nitrospira sp.]|nr:hypothetical protein [Nitrospira sp.]
MDMISGTRFHRTALLAIGVTLLYLGVMLFASACLVGHEVPSAGHHQHTDQPLHSALCAWACQANQQTSFVPSPQHSPPVLVVLSPLLVPSFVVRLVPFRSLRLRGPP